MRNTAERLRVYVGTTPETLLAAKVLECSIIRRTEMRVDFVYLDQPQYLVGDLPDNHKLRRWFVPQLAGWEGRAIYLDASMLFSGDVWDLFTTPEQQGDTTHAVWAAYPSDWHVGIPHCGLLLFNCSGCMGGQPGIGLRAVHACYYKPVSVYERAVHGGLLKFNPGTLPELWNAAPGTQGAKAVRFNKFLPCLEPDHPLGADWRKELSVVTTAGIATRDFLLAELAAGRLHQDFVRYLPTDGHLKKKRKVTEPSAWQKSAEALLKKQP